MEEPHLAGDSRQLALLRPCFFVEGRSDLHTVPCEGRDVRDDPLATEQDLRQALIDMIPIPGQAHAEGGELMKSLLAEFLRGFSLRTLIFLLDMVLPQLDAYHAGRQLQHLQPWTSVELAQRQERGQPGVELVVRYGYEAFAGFHVLQLLTPSCSSATQKQFLPCRHGAYV